jgi:hypothetical protein
LRPQIAISPQETPHLSLDPLLASSLNHATSAASHRFSYTSWTLRAAEHFFGGSGRQQKAGRLLLARLFAPGGRHGVSTDARSIPSAEWSGAIRAAGAVSRRKQDDAPAGGGETLHRRGLDESATHARQICGRYTDDSEASLARVRTVIFACVALALKHASTRLTVFGQRGVDGPVGSALTVESYPRQSSGRVRCHSDADFCVIARTDRRKRPYILDDTRNSWPVHGQVVSATADEPTRLRSQSRTHRRLNDGKGTYRLRTSAM